MEEINMEYKQYYGTKVRLIINARGYDKDNDTRYRSNVSMELNCIPVSETEKLLNLEDICIFNNIDNKNYVERGSVNKDHIIAIFGNKPNKQKSEP